MGHSKDEKEESDGKVDDHEAQKSMDETNYSSDHDVHDDDAVGNKTKQSQQTCPDRSKPLLSSKTTTTSATGAPPPTELLRAQGGIIISRPGAMHISGNSRVQDNDEESAVQTTSGLSPPAPQQDVLISAELVQQTPQEATSTDITAEVTPAPLPPTPPVATIPKPSSQPLVHAEPFQEREIGLREILKNRTVRITLAVCVVLIVFIVAVVVGVVLSMQKQDNHPFQEQRNPSPNQQDKKTHRPSTPPQTTTYHPSGPPNGSGSQSYSSSGNSGNETGGSGNETGGGRGKHGNKTGGSSGKYGNQTDDT